MEQSEFTAANPIRRSRKATHRRWFQFSLRGFLVVLTIGCLWLGWNVERAQSQREAVAKIESVGAIVYYDDSTAPVEGLMTIGSPLPWWHHLLYKVDNVVLPNDIRPADGATPDFKQALKEVIPALRRLSGLDTVCVPSPAVLSISDLSAEDARIQYAERELLNALPNCKIIAGEPAY